MVASSHRYDDAANTVRLAGYGILNLTAEWTATPALTLFLRADNVFDRDYRLAAGYSTGALTLTGNGGLGVAIQDDATTPSTKAGKGFSHYFGLNDIVRTNGFSPYETGLQPTDPNGFTSGAMTIRLTDVEGGRIRDIVVTPPAGGNMQDMLDALNSRASGVGLYGQFSMNSEGQISFASNSTTPSMVLATSPNLRLMASTILVAVWKFGLRSDRCTVGLLAKSVAISRSITAPFGMRPAVGVFTVTEEPLLPEADRPPTTTLPWARA